MKKFTLMLTAVLLTLVSFAQTQQCRFFDLSKNGITNYVYCLYIDQQNTTWIGAYGMLVKYNIENNYYIYDSTNSILQSQAAISNITSDNNGNIWLAYSYEKEIGAPVIPVLAKLNPETNEWTQYDPSNSILANYSVINCIAIDNDNCIWLGINSYTGNNFVKFDGNEWTIFDDGAHQPTLSIAIDKDNNKWITNYYGLTKFDGTSFTRYNGVHQANKIIIDSDNAIWVTGVESCLTIGKFVDGTWTYYNYSNTSLPKYDVPNKMIQDHSNNIWLTGFQDFENQILIKYNGNEWIKYNSANTELPANNLVNDVTIDACNNIWGVIDEEGTLLEFNDQGINDNCNGGNLGIGQNNVQNFTVSPNPANDIIIISGNSIKNINIFNILGQKVFCQTNNCNSNISVNTSNLNSGLYIVKVENMSGNVSEQKIIIKH